MICPSRTGVNSMYHSYRSYHAFGDYRDLFFIIPAVAVLVFILVGIFKRDLKSTSENKRKDPDFSAK